MTAKGISIKLKYLLSLSIMACIPLAAFEFDLKKSNENQEKANEILASYEKELAEDPNNVRLLNAIGLSYYALGEYKQAIIYFNRLLKLTPDDYSIKAF